MSFILPNKYLNPESSSLNACAIVIHVLKPMGECSTSKLFAIVNKRISDLTPDDFIISLNILFALGKLLYQPKNDKLVFIK